MTLSVGIQNLTIGLKACQLMRRFWPRRRSTLNQLRLMRGNLR